MMIKPSMLFISLLRLCLFQLLENIAEIDLFRDYRMEILDLDTLLLHCVTMTDGHAAVVERIMVDSHAERSTDRILTTISLAD